MIASQNRYLVFTILVIITDINQKKKFYLFKKSKLLKNIFSNDQFVPLPPLQARSCILLSEL